VRGHDRQAPEGIVVESEGRLLGLEAVGDRLEDQLRERADLVHLADAARERVEVDDEALAPPTADEPAAGAGHQQVGRGALAGDRLDRRPQVAEAPEVGVGQFDVHEDDGLRYPVPTRTGTVSAGFRTFRTSSAAARRSEWEISWRLRADDEPRAATVRKWRGIDELRGARPRKRHSRVRCSVPSAEK
jgi:hypothetical protein